VRNIYQYASTRATPDTDRARLRPLAVITGKGVAFEDAAQLAFLESGAHSASPLFAGRDRFDAGAHNVFDVGETPPGNLGLGRARDVLWNVGGLDVSRY
jgi:hypothetical protein